MDPTLLMALFGPEGMAGMMPPQVPQIAPPPMVPTGLTLANTPQVPQLEPQLPLPSTSMSAPPQEPYRSEPMGMPQGVVPTLGQALEPQVPMPRPRPAEAPQGGAAPSTGTDALLKSLRGVQAPAAPTPQKVSTPNAPQLRPIQAGGYLELLAAMGLGPQQALPGLKLPSTLGQALGGR